MKSANKGNGLSSILQDYSSMSNHHGSLTEGATTNKRLSASTRDFQVYFITSSANAPWDRHHQLQEGHQPSWDHLREDRRDFKSTAGRLQHIRDTSRRGITIGGTVFNGCESLPMVRATFQWLEPSSNGKRSLPTSRIATHR
ncbi:uncharacterized protein LOC112905846 [Agrilus planipennis]|uniref:Uncharacterized protein LOC112905846 n=1 Tax=Agrilus planipennis TaxID=224129 RepID=A0A7F5RFR4_AGRPL|nr:uncharacterized protein LOC112905846 [Agrilus planipennis]